MLSKEYVLKVLQNRLDRKNLSLEKCLNNLDYPKVEVKSEEDLKEVTSIIYELVDELLWIYYEEVVPDYYLHVFSIDLDSEDVQSPYTLPYDEEAQNWFDNKYRDESNFVYALKKALDKARKTDAYWPAGFPDEW